MKNDKLIKEIETYINTHLDGDLSLEEIAKNLHYSQFYLARTFAQETGETIGKCIQRRRLDLAAKKLVGTNTPIVEIAYEAHYSSQQAFTLAFRRQYLCTPQAYRIRGRLDVQSALQNTWKGCAAS